jgi:hypothetical protein
MKTRHNRTLLSIIAALALLTLAGLAAAGDFVPFVIPSRIDPQKTIWIADWKPIATNSGRLGADEHFHHDGRVRIWGMNLCFGANFPTHEDAPHVARRLAAAGVNSVRLHHMDTARWPRGIWNTKDGKTIEPQALDRLDYFINELAQRGIWVNVNLHVGRTHSEYLGLPDSDSNYDKVAGIFTPALIDAQKRYARELLTHVNPYRKVRYADDPAIAFVEITNEDSFFMWDGDRRLRRLPPYYAKILQGRFNDWLRSRYNSAQTLRAAWSKDTQPLGKDLLRNGTFTRWDNGTPERWNLERHEDCRASLSRPRGQRNAVQVDIGRANDTEWHLRLTQGGFPVTEGQYYTVSFRAAGAGPRTISCGVSQAHSPWRNLGLSRRVDLTAEWKEFSFGFVAGATDTNARISFAFSGDATGFKLANVEVRPGGQTVLAEGEALASASIRLFQDNESKARILDRMKFLAETEKAYFNDMRSYIKNDLGCGALVTGTIVFGPLGLYAQSDMDFIDAHAYWQHPRFPGRPWDQGNWTIEQKPMTDYPEQATLFRLAAERLAGKPFTVSEYNHPAPLDSQAECVPMIASFAAAQDWDGLWLFTYSHSTDAWDRQQMSNFFDMDTNPAKWGFMRAGTAIFRHERLAPLAWTKTVRIARPLGELPPVAALHLKHDRNMLNVMTEAGGISYGDMLQLRILGCELDSASAAAQRPPEAVARPSSLHWSTDKSNRGIYQAHGHLAHVYIGHAARLASETGRVHITSPDFVVLAITALDAAEPTSLETSANILVTACGRVENTGMQFSADRRTVGRNWGEAPVRIEAVRGKVTLPKGRWTCQALAPDGSPKRQVTIGLEDGVPVLSLSPEYETMWYLLERSTK